MLTVSKIWKDIKRHYLIIGPLRESIFVSFFAKSLRSKSIRLDDHSPNPG